ncbi:Clp protease ClpP [Exiguobacterium antarcticum]|uniref:ATP-dependent Clp protease proteolytic subunit n=1 Tax=Exiguobacterium antarcticum TaxID=132920 RepID=A0ABT6QZR9_9BACL|nr:head maturation protease, ClpP-related [Exiguobacterium antarcticum]MDI3234184.1 Clp protease ClpP [Exiguobacterium antarcticum]
MKINIKGPIIPTSSQWIYDYFEMEAVSPKRVADLIEQANGEPLDVEINSGGGSVFDASEIYYALKNYAGDVVVTIVGLAASAASVIAMAGKNVRIAPTAQMMIHNASTIQAGDYRDMQHTADFLKNTNKTITAAYRLKSGKTDEELLALMDEETWFTAEQALKNGLVDEVLFDSPIQAVASTDSVTLPQAFIDKIRNDVRFRPDGTLTNQVPSQAPSTTPSNQKEGNAEMELEELKNAHPALFEQVVALGRTEGATAEIKRIEAIDSLKKPQDISAEAFNEIVHDAKFVSNATAGDTAMKILNSASLNAQQAKDSFLENVQHDASNVNAVPGGDASNQHASKDDEQVNDLVAAFGGGKRA